ncbi:MAG: OmpA family protein [Ignavibacteriae bacterium]|nr:OmpA family protein [Ignavibacteriota bacterium]
MKKLLCILLFVFSVQLLVAQTSQPAQTFHRDGKWSLGMRGGGNVWFNDFDTRKLSGGGEVYLRYGFTKKFSLGLMGTYDALQAGQKELDRSGLTPLQYDYIQTKGISANVVAWFHLTEGTRFSPYVYLGVGGYQYKRQVSAGAYYPIKKDYRTLHIPFGFGFDALWSRSVGFNFDIGARIMDDVTDNWKGNVPGENKVGIFDWYATGKVGLCFYFGSSGSDDNDFDGLTNSQEAQLGTDPIQPDTDGDGLKDGEEVNVTKTNPKNADTDEDGLKDGAEVQTYKTDPMKPDTDEDGLKDGDEINTHHTDPSKTDTDVDGLKDGDEVTRGTDPLKTDTDADGLLDGDEVLRRTDPLKPDSDGGSVSDGKEVANQTNPLNPNDDVPKPVLQPVEVGKALVLEGIVFGSGKATIDPASEETLMQAFNTLKDNPAIVVEIRGYTDNVGSRLRNIKLSQQRAEAVRSWLVHKGIDSQRIMAKGFGANTPIADNKTPEGRQKNRRIEFFRVK